MNLSNHYHHPQFFQEQTRRLIIKCYLAGNSQAKFIIGCFAYFNHNLTSISQVIDIFKVLGDYTNLFLIIHIWLQHTVVRNEKLFFSQTWRLRDWDALSLTLIQRVIEENFIPEKLISQVKGSVLTNTPKFE